jgi:hypothetical protein
VDWDKLRSALGDAVDGSAERYSFTWAGKRDAITAHKRSGVKQGPIGLKVPDGKPAHRGLDPCANNVTDVNT